jgi:hypothetical protein
MSTHESFERDHKIQGGSDRNFGIVFAWFFGLVGVWPLLRRQGDARVWALVVGAAFLLAALTAPKLLAPLNWIWMRIGYALSRVTNVILLAILFFGVFSVVGWFMRLRGRDAMQRRFDRSAESYWIPRDPPGPAPESMARQF